jgi:hypothetical protein
MSSAPQRAAAVTYRPDIDGLRALAVIAGLLFHAHVAGFAGRYVGVDVFLRCAVAGTPRDKLLILSARLFWGRL